jgi:hypothetical protein
MMEHKPRRFPGPLEYAILRSVLYAALFEYPLTIAQLHRSLIESDESEDAVTECLRSSAFLRPRVELRDGYVFPRGRGDLVDERRRREAMTRTLLNENRWLLKIIGAVPYTRLVALSGSAAHLNVDEKADLDLFIVTRGRRVWSVTVTILLIAKLLRRRSIVCVNYVLSDDSLRLDQQDLFTANQIIHLRPLRGGEVFARFVDANPFVSAFYPNAGLRPGDLADEAPGRALPLLKRILESVGMCGPSQLYEAVCRLAYGRHLRGRASRWHSPDQVRLQSDCLKLHTHSHRRDVVERFEEAVNRAMAPEATQSERKRARTSSNV